MFTHKIKLFRLFGFSVEADATWILLALLVTWTLASGVFPYYFDGLKTQTYWIMAAVGAAGLFMSIILHELGHSLVARRFGLPIKSITLFVFGGVADMEEEPANAKVELLMAIAGPATSIVLSLVLFGASFALSPGEGISPLQGVLIYLAWLNGILAAFNLLPAFPLDGGRVFRALLWAWRGNLRWATRFASQVGGGFGIILIALGVVSLFTGNVIGGFWWILIGMFMRSASQSSYRHLLVRRALEGESLRRFMRTDVVTVPRYISLRELVEEYVYKYHYKMFPVVEDDRVLGCVSTRSIRDIDREDWDSTPVGEIVESCTETNSIPPDEDPMKALSLMSKTGNSRLLVVEGEQLVGIITLKDILSFLSLKMDLEEGEEFAE
ncbi:MAG: site-2 protease family protein [Candidatus Hydrogenedentota bacterium]